MSASKNRGETSKKLMSQMTLEGMFQKLSVEYLSTYTESQPGFTSERKLTICLSDFGSVHLI